MSCGPAASVTKAVDFINSRVDVTEKLIAALPDKVASIPGFAEAQLATQIATDLQNLKEIVDDPLALLDAAIPSLPLEFQNLIESGTRLAGDAAGYLAFVESLDEKYGDFDYGDPDDLLEAVNSIGGDIDKLCQIIPNIQKRGDDFIKKGQALSGDLTRSPNPIKFQKLKSVPLVLDYLDSFDAEEEQENKAEIDVTKAATERHLMQG